MRLPARAIVPLRVLTTGFFLVSAFYGVLNFSPFAYHQFIRAQLMPWLVWSATYYGGLFTAAFSITLVSLLRDVDRASTRTLALGFILFSGVAAVALMQYPIVGSLGPDSGSLLFAGAALLAALWVAAIDHLACQRAVFAGADDFPRGSLDYSSFVAGVAAALYVCAVYAGVAVVRQWASSQAAALSLVAFLRSVLLHVVVFTAVSWMFIAPGAVARPRRKARLIEYSLALLIFGGWIFIIMLDLVLPTIGLGGRVKWMIAPVFAVAITASWSGIALRLAADERRNESGLELFVRPVLPARATRALVMWLLFLPVVAYVALIVSERMDWGFLLQKGSVLAVWICASAAMVTLARRSRWSPSFHLVVIGSLVVLAGYASLRAVDRRASGDERFARLAAFDRYAAFDPSFRTLDDALADRSPTPRWFYRLLSANANIDPAVPISPRTIALTPRIARAAERPNIFL